MTCNPRVAAACLAVGWALAGCASAPKQAAMPPPPALKQDCRWVADQGSVLRMACLLSDEIPDTQWDAARPGSMACGSTSYSVFRQSVAMALRLSQGQGQKDEGGLARVRIDGTLGPGTHTGQVGKSTGNGCDATLGSVAVITTRYGGRYTAVVDRTQVPVCVSQSRLVLSTFEQTLSKALLVDLSQAGREATIDALQKRIDLEVATQANQHWRPSAPFLREVAVGRNGRCADGFRSLSGP